jgi:hypothetical protein
MPSCALQDRMAPAFLMADATEPSIDRLVAVQGSGSRNWSAYLDGRDSLLFTTSVKYNWRAVHHLADALDRAPPPGHTEPVTTALADRISLGLTTVVG